MLPELRWAPARPCLPRCQGPGLAAALRHCWPSTLLCSTARSGPERPGCRGLLSGAGRLRALRALSPNGARTRIIPSSNFLACHRTLAGTERRARAPTGAVLGLCPFPGPACWVPAASCPARRCPGALRLGRAQLSPGPLAAPVGPVAGTEQGTQPPRSRPRSGTRGELAAHAAAAAPCLPTSRCRHRRGQKPHARRPCKRRCVGLTLFARR